MVLDSGSFNVLRWEPSKDNRALTLANNLTPADIATSAVARNALAEASRDLRRGLIDSPKTRRCIARRTDVATHRFVLFIPQGRHCRLWIYLLARFEQP